MLLIAMTALVGAVFATGFRWIALSKYNSKMTRHQIWIFDVGSRYGWLFLGLVLLIALAIRDVPVDYLLSFALYWLLGLAAIWLIPNKFITSR